MPSTLILLRHGQSTWNLENLFTGWYDAALTAAGEAQAVAGGHAMAEAGVLPDVVHTSLQTRAIRTANLALEAIDRLWIPVHRSWRLNERHYGALQGKDKKATREEHGDELLQLWRRSYDTPPPPVESDSEHHPRHDARYAHLAPEVLPRAECLADVVDRVVPYWVDALVPDLAAGRTVLVAAHGNSLRALVMHLDGLTPAEIAELNLPTGVPFRYEMDDEFRPIDRVPVLERALGDVAAAKAAAEAVARQAG